MSGGAGAQPAPGAGGVPQVSGAASASSASSASGAAGAAGAPARAAGPPRRRRTWLRLLLGLAVALLADQTVQWLCLSDGLWEGRQVAPFDPPLFNTEQRASLERLAFFADGQEPIRGNVRFDAQLGWAPQPGSDRGTYSYDEHGARRDGTPLSPFAERAARAAAGVFRVVTIGCSFTHGDEVEPGQTWAARLEAHVPGLEIANLGVGAYGLDQALLRLQRDGLELQPDAVWLGWVPDVTLRVTTLYPPACRHQELAVSCKPRFLLDDLSPDGSGLRLVQNPAASVQALADLLFDQRAFLEVIGRHDLWVQRHPLAYAPHGSHWTSWFAVSRLYLTREEGHGREAARWLLDDGSEPSRLVEALVRRTAEVARAAGAGFRLLVLPSRRDLRERAAGPTPWAAVCARLEAAGIEVLDTTAALLALDALEDDALWQSGGHYGPGLNEAVAGALAAEF